MARYEKGEPPNKSKEAKKREYAKRTPRARAYGEGGSASSPSGVAEGGTWQSAAVRAALRIANKGKRPSTDQRRAAMDKARAKSKAKAKAKKDDRTAKYSAKREKALEAKDKRVAEKRNAELKRQKAERERERMRADEAHEIERMKRRAKDPQYQARKKQSQFKQSSTRVRDKDGNWGWR